MSLNLTKIFDSLYGVILLGLGISIAVLGNYQAIGPGILMFAWGYRILRGPYVDKTKKGCPFKIGCGGCK